MSELYREYFEELPCDACGAVLGFVSAMDLNGSDFRCVECFRKLPSKKEGKDMATKGSAAMAAKIAAAAPPVAPVSPNRMKFASLVQQLDPHQPDFATRVAQLKGEFDTRELIISDVARIIFTRSKELAQVLPDGNKVTGYAGPLEGDEEGYTVTDELLDTIRKGVERFVVDRY